MKIKKKILYIIAFLLFFICIGANQSKAGYLKLNNLDFQTQINADGSMDVTETWDINIKSTNTLYKTFKTDNSKYSEITNVTVTDITNGIQNNFIQTSEWAYHANQYTKPFNEISGVVTELQNALTCAGRVMELIEEEPQAPEPENARTVNEIGRAHV